MNRSEPLLQVFDLSVEVAKRRVLQSVSLAVPAGALVVLMGANGSGKSTLGMTLAGHPAYRATHGHVRFGGQDLLAMSVQERARAGLFLSFQAPPDIPGVKNNLFVRTALNAVREARGDPARGAHAERYAERELEFLHGLRQCGGRYVQPARRRADAAFVGHGDERFQLMIFHGKTRGS